VQGIEQGLWGVGAVGFYRVAGLTSDLVTGYAWSGIPVVGQCVTIRQGLQQHRGHVLAILLFRATAFPGDGDPVAVIDRAHIHPQRTAAGPGDDGSNELSAALNSGRRHPAVGDQLPALVQTFGGDVCFDVDQGRNHARSITLVCPLFPAPPGGVSGKGAGSPSRQPVRNRGMEVAIRPYRSVTTRRVMSPSIESWKANHLNRSDQPWCMRLSP
jgi:hypothetical protein